MAGPRLEDFVSLWDLVEQRATLTPDHVIASDEDGRTLTCTEYRDWSERVAAGLMELGVGRDVNVSWLLPTWLEAFVLVGALARLEAIQNPMLPIYRDREVQFITQQTQAKLIITPHFNILPGGDPESEPERVFDRCRAFGVTILAADGGGNGHLYNRLLMDLLGNRCYFFAILYSTSEQAPRQEGLLWRWTVNRSASIGLVFSRVKKQLLLFPGAQDSSTYLDEFACEVAEYDDYHRCIKYTHPETQPDDCLHATNYALLVGVREYGSRVGRGSGLDLE
jgi:hypothetical protein